jgi:hypothetical protein
MTRDQMSGAALMAGAAAAVAVMAFHPTGHDMVAGLQRDSQLPLQVGVLVHVLALIAFPLVFFGAVGLTMRIARDHGLATAALIALGVASVAVMGAALPSGLIAPRLIRDMADAGAGAHGGDRAIVQALLHYNGLVNQAYAKVHLVASCIAIALWCVVMWRERVFARWIAIFGLLVSTAAVLLFAAGQLRLDIHGYGAVILAQGVWFAAVGWSLWRTREEPSSSM